MDSNKKNNVTLTIKNIYGVGFWSYDSINDKCPICDINLSFPVTINNNKYDVVTIMNCGHGYHVECIKNNTNDECSICKNNNNNNDNNILNDNNSFDINSDDDEYDYYYN